ncbi:exonuclease domain-containing protein [Bacillus sp. 1P06AnD]|uniref:exonuclease domain-containing protein n=1 Tax=Bacillus sp. 1P06AnD TaxID=3132208 RepID=UPI0039A33B12
MDFIAVDFETANRQNNSACSLGMVFVENNQVVDEQYFMIQPPSLSFDAKNISIHGITPEDVKDEPTFDLIWPKIEAYFSGIPIIAHNAFFDMSVLKACLKEYHINKPDFPYLDSIQLSTKALTGFKVGQSLKERSAFFHIDLSQHHNALADARACAEIVIKSIEMKKRKSLSSFLNTYKTIPVKHFSELKGHASFPSKKTYTQRVKTFAPSIKISELKPSTGQFDINHPFFEKNIVFTGELEGIERKQAMQAVIDAGAKVKSTVSKLTNYLIVGTQDQRIVGPNGMSSKEIKAIDLMHEGHPIEILTESDFIKMIAGTSKRNG